jgi:hypothetical protein
MVPQNNVPQTTIQIYQSHTMEEFKRDYDDISVFVSPDTHEVRSIVNELLHLLSNSSHKVMIVSYFKSASEAQSAYLNSSYARNIIGINFTVLTQTASNYTIRIASADIVSTEEQFEVSG